MAQHIKASPAQECNAPEKVWNGFFPGFRSATSSILTAQST